jgi:hypothetical protein
VFHDTTPDPVTAVRAMGDKANGPPGLKHSRE